MTYLNTVLYLHREVVLEDDTWVEIEGVTLVSFLAGVFMQHILTPWQHLVTEENNDSSVQVQDNGITSVLAIVIAWCKTVVSPVC